MESFRKKVNVLNEKIISMSKKFDETSRLVECFTIIIYILAFVIIAYYHEPWSDETTSYAIAKDATIKEMLFRLGHGEGHPALWWILLSPFAKSGVSAKITLGIVSLGVNLISVCIILFKFKIPKIIRISIPFTFYLFYQYGIISRCYCLLILGFCLLTLVWNEKEKKPFKTIFCMLLICLSTAYGLVLMFGLALTWIYDVLRDNVKGKKIVIRSLLKNSGKEIIALSVLAIVAFLIVLEIMPSKDAYAVYIEKKYADLINNKILNFLYLLVLEPIDALFYSSIYEDTWLSIYKIELTVFIIGALLSLLFFFIMFTLPKSYGKRRYFVIPQLIFVIVCTFSFYYSHHTGITTVFFMFWIVSSFTKEDAQETKLKYNNTFYGKFLQGGEGNVLLKYEWIIYFLIILVSVGWTISSCILEVKAIYSPEQEYVKMINNYSNREYKVYATHQASLGAYKTSNMTIYKTIFDGREVDFTLLDSTADEVEEKMQYWVTIGFPDVIDEFESGIIEYISEELGVEAPEYRMIDYIDSGKIFKGIQDSCGMKVFMRTDLADELGGLGLYKIDLQNNPDVIKKMQENGYDVNIEYK